MPTQAGEQVTQNNARDALIQVNDRAEKVLYYEGEPRFEYKFLRARRRRRQEPAGRRRSHRTAENKYYRQSRQQPRRADRRLSRRRAKSCSQYRGLILGSVEAASFTPEQLRMIADFVNKRGGGLLMLGGRRSFAEGGWGGTPVGDVLPVVLENANAKYFSELFQAHPTRAGATFPVTQIAGDEKASSAKWNEMAPVSSVNPIREAKPGATVLLTGVDSRKQDQIVLAYQRYGRGKAIALPMQDTWLWQMDPKMPVTDTTHAMFWRRLVRWLVDGVPEQVNVSTTADRVEPGEAVKLSAEVLDSAYVEVNDSRVVARVTSPSGKTTEVPVEWTVDQGRRLPRDVHAGRAGHLRRQGHRGARSEGARHRATCTCASRPATPSTSTPAMRAPLLKRIAEDTGGRFFTPANAASLPEAISYSGRGVTVVEERELWDMPALFLAAGRPDRRRVGLSPHARPGMRHGRKKPRSTQSTQRKRLLSDLCVSLRFLACRVLLQRDPRARRRSRSRRICW